MNKLVYVILVNYKNHKDTIECLESLRQVEYKKLKVLIIDNNSENESILKIKEKLKDEELICSKVNLGFAGANNIGIKKAIENGGDYILLLNNDTIVETDFVNHMVSSFEKDNNVGIVGSKINYYEKKDTINYAGGEIIWEKFTSEFYRTDELDNKENEKEEEISFVSGCCMMIKKEVVDKIGYLDHEYFMYYEDTDYCAKASINGFKLIYQPKAKIYHKISASSGGDMSPFVLYWSTKNRIVFKRKFRKNVNFIKRIKFDIYNFITRVMRWCIYVVKGDIHKANAILKGYMHGVLGGKDRI